MIPKARVRKVRAETSHELYRCVRAWFIYSRRDYSRCPILVFPSSPLRAECAHVRARTAAREKHIPHTRRARVPGSSAAKIDLSANILPSDTIPNEGWRAAPRSAFIPDLFTHRGTFVIFISTSPRLRSSFRWLPKERFLPPAELRYE